MSICRSSSEKNETLHKTLKHRYALTNRHIKSIGPQILQFAVDKYDCDEQMVHLPIKIVPMKTAQCLDSVQKIQWKFKTGPSVSAVQVGP